jgi:diguanylate cyclase (GGDEF)-like protein/PAS domain S-box-containing protein
MNKLNNPSPKETTKSNGTNGSYKDMELKLKKLSDLQKKTEELFRKSEEYYKSFFQNSIDGIYKSTLEGNYIEANPALVKMLGYKNREELFSVDFPNQLYISKKDRPSKKEKNALFETQFKKKDGTVIWVEVSSRIIYNKKNPAYYEGIVRNITERKISEEKIIYLSFHDNLTGLYNRAYFEEEVIRLSTKRQLPLCFIIGDINSLRLVNNAFGHLVGDQLIVKVAELLKKFFRQEDIISRWGGDEFAILLPKTQKKHADEIIDRIKKECALTEKQELPVSISLGIASREEISRDFQDVIKEAEDNMYRSKLIEKKSINSSIISSLERTLFEKSIETREHAERLKKFSQEIGKVIHLADNKIDELSLLSTLHDIGKVAIPEDIIISKRKLKEREWNIIKKHSLAGHNICESNPQLVHIADGVLGHHEWWDGSGYPQGLRFENIPITSRIISIVDAYDVMTSGRAYKKAITKKEAIKELKKCQGTQFDPKLVDIFIDIVLT